MHPVAGKPVFTVILTAIWVPVVYLTNNLICGQIVIHNDQWLGFVAVSQSMSIEVTSSNCVLGEGIQIAFFNACNAPDALVCNPGIVNGEGIPLDLTYNNFTPGQTYYLMIDGSFGDVCDFNVDITSGTVTPPAPDIASQPVGPTQLCPELPQCTPYLR